MTADAHDPLSALRLVDAPLAVRAGFTAALRHRVVEELGDLVHSRPTGTRPTDEQETTMAAPLSPYLAVHDAAAAIAYLTDVFGAVETLRYTDDTGRIGHAEIAIGEATLMLSDEFPDIGVRGPLSYGGTSVMLHLTVVDVDYSYERAVRFGGTGQRPPADQGHGNRNATVVDPFGHRWMLSQPLGDSSTSAADDAPPADDTWTITGRRPVEVGYLTMPTTDSTAASTFYAAVLDWQVDPQGGHIGNTRLPMGLSTVSQSGPAPVLYFRVDDLDPYVARVEDAGGRVVERTQSTSGDGAECIDDQGFTFHLWRPAPGY